MTLAQEPVLISVPYNRIHLILQTAPTKISNTVLRNESDCTQHHSWEIFSSALCICTTRMPRGHSLHGVNPRHAHKFLLNKVELPASPARRSDAHETIRHITSTLVGLDAHRCYL